MGKKKSNKQEYKPTKRYLSRLKKQQRRQKIILFSGIGTVAVAVVMVVLGLIFQWYIPQVKPMSEVVVEVNGIKYKMNYYLDSLRYQTSGQDQNVIPYFLDPVANTIINNELIRQYAEELGYTVSDSEVDDLLNENDIEINPAVRDYTRAYILQQKLMDDYFKGLLPAETEHRTALAMFLESEAQVDEVLARLDAGESFSDIAEELSLDKYTKDNSGDLGSHPTGVISENAGSDALEEAIFDSGTGTGRVEDSNKSKQVGYWIIKVIERRTTDGTEEAHVQVMLLGSSQEAEQIKARLDQGEDFEELAKENSQVWTEDNPSDIGWIAKQDVSSAFDSFAFSEYTEPGQISDPVKDVERATKGGWWLYQVTDIENKAISDDDADILVYQDLQDWIKQIKDNPDNETHNYLDEDLKAFALSKILG